ncbi:MAG: response regulator transcription factor [Thermoleophilaceae bacterium]|nr:response regulator transcription factor [Thermoleophilaceae bacterium]
MSDAWIYCVDRDFAGELGRGLAELGYSPRHVSANGSLLPKVEEADAVRRPALIVVAACAGEEAPHAVLRRLRDHEDLAEVPCVAALEPEHLAAGADVAGAHELLVGPFEPAELGTRVGRAREQVNGVDADEAVRAGSLELNLATYQVTIGGDPVSFTFVEYELLKFLITHPHRVFSRESLLSAVWGYDYYGGARTVDVHVRRVRAKLGQEHAGRIKTVRSVGYRFEL